MTDRAISTALTEQALRSGDLDELFEPAAPSGDELLLGELRELVLRFEGGDVRYLALLVELLELHLVKSAGYGDGADRMANFTGVSAITGEPRHRYPRRRMVEKLLRCEKLEAAGRDADLDEELIDIAGLSLCALLMRQADASSS